MQNPWMKDFHRNGYLCSIQNVFVADSSAVFSTNEIFQITMFDWNFLMLGLSLNLRKAC